MRKILLIISLLSSPSFAGYTIDLTDPKHIEIADAYPSYEVLKVINFEDTGDGLSLFGFKSKKYSEDWDVIFHARISNSQGGDQKIYITLSTECSNTEKSYGEITIKTNEQNVRYSKYCDGKHFYITPLSKAGDNFLVNEFKKKNNVILKFSDFTLFFDATGFTKAWKKAGGDAL
jgi:hypothetical protein